MKVIKEKIDLGNGKFELYLKVMYFRDEVQCDVMKDKIERDIKDLRVRTKVFQGKVLRAFPTST